MSGISVLNTPTTSTITTTGTQTALAIPGGAGDLVIFANNATLLTLQGILAPTIDGQKLTIFSIGAGQVDLANQNGSATAANRIINGVTGTIALAAGSGRVELRYDLTTARWRVVSHTQGAFITPTYSAGDFTTDVGTWTVEAADVQTYAYYLSGRQMTLALYIKQTTVASSPTTLRIAAPAGHVIARQFTQIIEVLDNGVAVISAIDALAAATYLRAFATLAGPAWAASTNQTYVIGTVVFEVQ